MSAAATGLSTATDSDEVCDNAGSTPGDLGVPGCFRDPPENRVEVVYYEKGSWSDGTPIRDSDTSYLCDGCTERVAREAKSHGYDVDITELVM